MRRSWQAAIAALALSITSGTAAHADWGSRAMPPDVFGNTTAIATDTSATGDALVVQCNSKDSLDLAIVSPATKSELDMMSRPGAGIPGLLLVRADQGPVSKFAAVIQQWNNTYIGIVASGRTTDLVATIHAIGNAKTNISVGSEVAGDQHSETFSAAGSTAAIATLIKACKLDDITAAPNDTGKPKQ